MHNIVIFLLVCTSCSNPYNYACIIMSSSQGQTGFPFIDAIMRQLHMEGWIPDVARQIVGSFLTRGCMWISWEQGFKVKSLSGLHDQWQFLSIQFQF